MTLDVSAILGTVLGAVLMFWLKNLHKDVKDSVIGLARLESKIDTIKERTDVIPKLQQDIQGFHAFKRRVVELNKDGKIDI